MENQAKKLLIIEDEESIRNVLREKFGTEKSIKFLSASDGLIGLEMAEKECPDLILLDVLMPHMHGIEVLDKLQSTEWGKRTPVILLTNYENDPKVVEAIAQGRCGLLSKGKVSLDTVVMTVKQKLGLAD